MSVGAMCFASSGSHGSCWVVLVIIFFFFSEKSVCALRSKKKCTQFPPPKKFCVLFPYVTYAEKRSAGDLRKKKSDLRFFPHVTYAFPAQPPGYQGKLKCSY